jgi:hypothetical protein
LTEKFGFFERSKPVIMASNFWPTWKRSDAVRRGRGRGRHA